MERVRLSRVQARQQTRRSLERQQRSAANITALKPITIRAVNDFDVQVVHMFADDTGNISVGLTTAGGTANVLLSPKLARQFCSKLIACCAMPNGSSSDSLVRRAAKAKWAVRTAHLDKESSTWKHRPLAQKSGIMAQTA